VGSNPGLTLSGSSAEILPAPRLSCRGARRAPASLQREVPGARRAPLPRKSMPVA
jgi:hypothetical protein